MNLHQLLTQSWVVIDTTDRRSFYPTYGTDVIAIEPNPEKMEATVLHTNRVSASTDYRACTMDDFLKHTNFGRSGLRRLFNNLTPVNFSDYNSLTSRRMNIVERRRARLRGEDTVGFSAYMWNHNKKLKREAADMFHESVKALREYAKEPLSSNYRHMRNTLRDWFEHVNCNDVFTRGRERMYERMVEIANDLGVDDSDLPFKLADCGHWEDDGDITCVANGESVCLRCRDEDYRYVEDESDYYRYDECYYWDSDGEYHLSPEPEDDDEDEGESDLLNSWGASTGRLAHDRSFTPSQWGDFTLGVELEVEAQEERYERLVDCDGYFNRDMNYAMFKRDGSLNEYRGFEIVTAARKMGDHIEMFKRWQPRQLTAWGAGNCGMHVHIDSRAFSALSLGKFMMLMNDHANAEFIRAIAGRHPLRDSQAESYAATTSQETLVNPARAKKGAGNSRYRLVNLTNLVQSEQNRLQCEVCRDSKGSYSTVELRVFRASLKKERLLAQIEFTHASVMYCRVASWHDLNGPKFKDWLSRTPGYPHLAKWLGVNVCRSTPLKARAATPVAEEV